MTTPRWRNADAVNEASLTYLAFADCDPPTAVAQRPCSLPEMLNQRYRLEQILGNGGMSVVYRAHDARRAELGDPQPYVAIKILNEACHQYPDANALLYSEFAMTQRLHHPHVVRTYDIDIDQMSGRAFISMEWLQGMTLDRLLAERPDGIPWPELHPIVLATLNALAHCHEQGVQHGDLKPGNLLLGDDGIKLFDFGLGQSTRDSSAGRPRLQRSCIDAWTPGYAAAEVVEGNDLSDASDVYAMGCVLYELITGRHPYQRQDARRALELNLERDLRRPQMLGRRSWEALRVALRLDRAGRNVSAQELYEAFK